MAYAFVTASSQYLEAGAAAVTALPFTMAGWFNAATTHTGAVLGVGTNNSTIRAVLFAINDGTCRFACNEPNPVSSTTGTYGTSAWHHVAGVADTSIWQAYLDGATAGAANDATAPPSFAGCDLTAIGMRESTTPGSFFNGSIAEPAIWNVALTVPEIAALAKGYSPRMIRPAALVFYAPLIRELVNPKGGFALTNNNGATVSPHSRVIYPKLRGRG